MKKIVLATSNNYKKDELLDTLSSAGFDMVMQTDFGLGPIAETGTTFIENAIIKARHASHSLKLPAIAEDSGLTVDILQGAPGVYSARYANQSGNDQKNIEKLLKNMKHAPYEQRGAQLNCVLVYFKCADDPMPIISYATWSGVISQNYDRFTSNSFGYDSIFYVPELGKTAANLNKIEKFLVSHRGKALRKLIKKLQNE